MIIYEDIELIRNLPFNDYLKLEARSHSFLKSEVNGVAPEITITDNMLMGSMVDAILTEPHTVKYSSKFYKPARRIADKITSMFGNQLAIFENQVSFTATAVCEKKPDDEAIRWKLRVKGRLDKCVINHIALDLKYTKQKNFSAVIEFFGYDNQLWHYAKGINAKKAFILVYIDPLDKVELIEISLAADNAFWESRIIQFGSVL